MNFLLLNHVIALFLTSAVAFIVGIFVLFKSRGEKTNLAYSVWSLSVAWWSFFAVLLMLTNSVEQAIIYARLLWFPVLLIAVSTAHFVILFLEIKGKELFIKIGYVLCAFFAIMSFTPYMVSSIQSLAYLKYWVDMGALLYLNFIIFAVYVVYQMYQLFKARRTSTGVRHSQINYIFWASLLGYTGGLSNYLLAFKIYIPIIHPFASYLLIVYSLVVAMAIFKYQLMDIRVIIKKAFFYSSGIALISGAIFGVSFLNSWFADNFSGFKPWMIPLLSGMVAFIIGNLFWNKSQEAEKLKYEFLTVAAHKLRTPLTEIKWAVEASKDTKEIEEKDKLFDNIESSNSRLITLTDELLSVAKAESGQAQYKLEPVNLEEIARRAVNDFQHRMKEKNIKLNYKYERGLPKVMADKTRISSVIQILLENATQYTKDEIKINIDSHKDSVVFHIEDNGIGIKKEDQSHIFSKFYRSHEAYLTETEGTGIGLFLAKSIINKHNGKIGLKSEGEGNGSVFWFDLEAVK